MAELHNVVKGLECCALCNGESCRKCPYQNESHGSAPMCTAHLAGDALALLKEQEAVVRCKDCKYWHSNTEFCGKWSVNCCAHHTSPDWFCADGERKDGEQNE